MSQQKLFSTPQTEMTSDDYYTPKWLFDVLDITFDVDVCAPPGGPLHTPCKKFYTQEIDGLSQQWKGNVFMNPPFSKNKIWIERFHEHGYGICLTFMSKSKAFRLLWNNADGAVNLPTDWRFITSNGLRNDIFMPCMLFAYGKKNAEALQKVGKVRVLQPKKNTK